MANFPGGSFPGMVTPQVTGSTYQNPTSTEQARMYELEDRKEAERKQRNAEIQAQHAAQQQAAKDAADREQVRAAFNQLYAPQMQAAYHDQMVMSEGVPGTGVPGRGMTIAGPGGQSRLASGNMKPWSEPGSYTPAGGWYKPPQDKLNTALDNMWRMQTDPYMQAAKQLGKGMMGGMLPSVGATAPAILSKKSGQKITNKPKEEEPQGIDWWNKQNEGGALLR